LLVKGKEVKSTAVDFPVPTISVDLRFLALQAGSIMGIGGQLSCAFPHPSCLSSQISSGTHLQLG